MKLPTSETLKHLGIRSKLILLFVVIKVVPLLMLALLAWEGVTRLGSNIGERTDGLTAEVRDTVASMGKTFSKEAERALDDRAREELERLTTDTARAVANFLYERDRDLMAAASLEPSEGAYSRFVSGLKRLQTPIGEWELGADGKGWVPKAGKETEALAVSPSNAENKQDFHYRPPEKVQPSVLAPLYHEITFIGLDGVEKFKVSQTKVLPQGLKDVSRRENTYAKAETYWPELKKLKAGEIYVSDVIGPYVPSRVIGPVTPEKAKTLNIPFEPEKEAFAGKENPKGKPFRGIIRWATPVVRGGNVVGYVTLALDHTHLMSFTNNLMPTPARYTAISDATNGNYAFMWDYKDRSIVHPRHHSIVGVDPATGEYATPWLEASIYEGWQKSGKPLKEYLKDVPIFDGQSREKKPAKPLTVAGNIGLDCRYLNFAPQCQGWRDLTQHGGSGSFLILWTGVWKLTTAAAIPYFSGHYGKTPRGFGYVTIGANVDEFHKPALATAKLMETRVTEFGERMKEQQTGLRNMITENMAGTAFTLLVSTLLMVGVVVIIAVWLANMFTKRITSLVGGLETIEKGDFSFRFQKQSDDEFGHLTDSLNKMADSVHESFTRLEDAKLQAEEASRMKSDFLARMSHELRTPLNGILGFAELIKLDAPNPELEENADTIYQSGQHLLALVNDILDLAKIEAGHMTLESVPLPLPQLLGEVANIHRGAAQAKGLNLETSIAEDLPTSIQGDPTRLRQVINNLLNNAVKFTAEGSVSLEASCREERIYIAIADTGPGIPAEAQALIFEKFRQASSFVTREHGGTGLGLALVRELVTLMGGEINLSSETGKGSRFEFWIPLQLP